MRRYFSFWYSDTTAEVRDDPSGDEDLETKTYSNDHTKLHQLNCRQRGMFPAVEAQ